ncbi:MAG: SDR family NAD(P)-dependent oxidoreductase [Aureispira sp.]|nr:SDR family NAD(P)-dependent oxidoreductase [Aureispira sp.]
MQNKPHKYNLLEHFLFLPTWLNKRKLQQYTKGKTILITGASYGIGEQLAYLLAQQGTHLLLVARTQEKLIEVKSKVEQLKGYASVYPIDLTENDQIEELLKELPENIDIVVSNAGKSIMRSIYKSLDRFHDFQRTMALNYFGPVQLLLGLIPKLEQSKGHIINTSAVNVLLAPAPYWAAYQASKTSFDQWFRCVAPEIRAKGIKSSSIYLPLVKTRMIAPTKAYDNVPAMSPEHVAKIIAKTICTGRRKFAPWWLIFGQLGSVIFRTPWEWMSTYFIKRKQK